MLKLRKGDRVRVRRDLEFYKKYGNIEFDSKIRWSYLGKVVTIDEVSPILKDCYRIKEDAGTWMWSAEMFKEKVEEQQESLWESLVKKLTK